MRSKFTQSLRTAGILIVLGSSLVAHAANFTLTSPTLRNNGTLPKEHVFSGFGCTGGNHSPELAWTNVPEGTQSFAVTVFDPDAPTDSGWWHWLAVNIPNTAKGLSLDAGNEAGTTLPVGAVQIRSDFGSPSYGGACPPEGAKPHRYIFTVYALKVKSIELPTNASAALASFMIKANAIGKASITSLYGR